MNGFAPMMLNATPQDLAQMAPNGRLRAAINLGNPILANRDASTGEVFGVSVDLAQEFARQLNLPLSLHVVDTAGKSVEAVSREEADFGFFAIDPKRGEDIAFTAPYVLIEGSYAVRADSPITRNDEVDQAGNTVVVGLGSAYDLYLSRELKNAQILRAPSSPQVVEVFMSSGKEVAAGVRQQLQADLQRIAGLRLLEGRFMVIQQAMGSPRRRGTVPQQLLGQFIEQAKRSGFVAQALARHHISGAGVAP
jgi:polar amino acid transport system substrate-binding protein